MGARALHRAPKFGARFRKVGARARYTKNMLFTILPYFIQYKTLVKAKRFKLSQNSVIIEFFPTPTSYHHHTFGEKKKKKLHRFYIKIGISSYVTCKKRIDFL